MLLENILNLPRNAKRSIVLIVDFFILLFSLWASFSLRLGEFYRPEGDILYLYMAVPVIAIPIFVRFGLYRAVIRYIGFLAMWAVIKAVSLYTLVWGVFVLLSGIPGVPRSVLLINWLVAILLIGGTRAIARWWLTGNLTFTSEDPTKKNVAIYGAGSAGVQLAMALSDGSDFNPVAFIDDNKSLQGNYIQGLRVYAFSELSTVISDLSVRDVLLAMPSVPRSRRGKIITMLEPFSVHVSTLPGMSDLASGKIKVDDVREVGVLELLGREPVKPDLEVLNLNVMGKVVLVTGAGGSIGSELCRQIIRLNPASLILFERSEHDLYRTEKDLTEIEQRIYPGEASRITPILASILNQNRMESVCRVFAVQTIYHAAAYKHVPIVEKNPSEAVRNNVLGTYMAAMAAIDAKVETFVLISTDKAVRPTNTMGATKRFAEMILQGLSKRDNLATRFTMVRFGNVLASSGSVVPLFREQILKGGPVTVTDPEIIRYFMTIPEAAQLVIQAGAMGQGGDVFVLDMGEPVKIVDLARRLIHFSGLTVIDATNPDGDIEIVYSGLRPGEKLYEELLIGENVVPTKHELIMSANEDCLPWEDLQRYIDQFQQAIDSHDVETSRALLVESVTGFNPQCEIADLVQEQMTQNGSHSSVNSLLKYPV